MLERVKDLHDLREDIQSKLNASHALDETNWDEPDEGNDN